MYSASVGEIKRVTVLYMKSYVRVWYLAELFLEWRILLSCREDQNAHFMFYNLKKKKNLAIFWGNVQKCGRARKQMTI
jgi:hypothetical protein